MQQTFALPQFASEESKRRRAANNELPDTWKGHFFNVHGKLSCVCFDFRIYFDFFAKSSLQSQLAQKQLV